jgi:hypothetical protein
MELTKMRRGRASAAAAVRILFGRQRQLAGPDGVAVHLFRGAGVVLGSAHRLDAAEAILMA